MVSDDTRGAGKQQQHAKGRTRWEQMERTSLTLEKLCKLHETAYRANNKSESTIRQHTSAIMRFSKWIREEFEEEPILASFTLSNMRAFVVDLREQMYREHGTSRELRKLSPSTVSWYVRALRSFSTWLYEEEYTSDNILKRLNAPDVPDYDVDILSHDEIEAIVKIFNYHTEKGARDLAVFMTFLDSGMRVSELVGLKMSNLHLDQGYVTVFGKGKKERPVKVGSRTIKAIKFYIAHWRNPARPNVENVFLTVSKQVNEEEQLWSGSGEPLSPNAVKHIIKRIGNKAGVPRLHAHLLRHTFACMFLMEHHDPFALKNLLGHTSLTMTYRYVRAVERLMVVQGDMISILDSITLPLPSPKSFKKGGK